MKTKTCDNYLNDLAAINRLEGGTGSDYAISKIMGVSPSRISNYRRGVSQFDDEFTFKLADKLDINPAEIMAAINVERAKTDEKKKFWRAAFRKVHGTAAAVIMSGILTGLPALSGVYTSLVHEYCILC